MKHRFTFMGVAAPARRTAQKATIDALATVNGAALLAFARACWKEPEREFQYVAADALHRHQRAVRPEHLAALGALITSRSWWDTVDVLAVHAVGAVVGRHRPAASVMDAWIDADNIWLVRSAILHQLRYKDRTDAQRLFAYADRRAADSEFFVRKALGWALRQYARTDPAAVRRYVESRGARLSALTRRVALRHL